MKIPLLKGMIRRRMLINFRVEPGLIQKLLPTRFRPKLHHGYAIAGICLIRLEHIRPEGFPAFVGFSSENAAHRIAVEWKDATGNTLDAVFISRRDTGSMLNHLTGGRIFSGEHHLAIFNVADEGGRVDFVMQSCDNSVSISVRGFDSDHLPATSCFASLDETSRFFESGSLGYSVTSNHRRLDGLELKTSEWRVRPLAIEAVKSSFFSDTSVFPAGTSEFDHALIMRDIPHQWHQADEMFIEPRT